MTLNINIFVLLVVTPCSLLNGPKDVCIYKIHNCFSISKMVVLVSSKVFT
jgi:hypothetical protein